MAVAVICLVAVTAAAQTYELLAVFDSFSKGANPIGPLLQAADGNLYGTTESGGTPDGWGTIFKIDTNSMALTTIHTFTYYDGALPYAGLIQAPDGNLYGTTTWGGYGGVGTIFKIDPSGASFTTLHSFTDGQLPLGGLIQANDGRLYGTTAHGGATDDGTIFRIDLSGTTYTTVHDFDGPTEGRESRAPLIQAADGNLYGTTSSQGPNGWGTVFKIDTNGTVFTTLHSFSPYFGGAEPHGGLVQARDSNLYGVAYVGGTNGYGAIFKIDTAGTTYTELHGFARDDGNGAKPSGTLIQGTDGRLYGTTQEGGPNGYGTVFEIDTDGSSFTTLHSFSFSDGAIPVAGLIQATDGRLYGTTFSGGGPQDLGVVFRFTLLSDSDSDGIPDDSDQCPQSDLAATVVVGGCDSGVPNTLFASGCSITDRVLQCAAGAKNHGAFVSCVSDLANELRMGGTINGAQEGALEGCAGRARIP